MPNPRTPRKSPVMPMILSWLIPGYGFFINGHRKRGVFFFVVLQLTFIIGVVLRGAVLIPEFSIKSPAFNLVNILTFLTQMFNGALGILSMLPDLFGRAAALFPTNDAYIWADLGAFFLLVSGGMNYFVLVTTYDNFYAVRPGALQVKVKNS